MWVALRYIIMYTNEQSDKAYVSSKQEISTHVRDVRCAPVVPPPMCRAICGVLMYKHMTWSHWFTHCQREYKVIPSQEHYQLLCRSEIHIPSHRCGHDIEIGYCSYPTEYGYIWQQYIWGHVSWDMWNNLPVMSFQWVAVTHSLSEWNIKCTTISENLIVSCRYGRPLNPIFIH